MDASELGIASSDANAPAAHRGLVCALIVCMTGWHRVPSGPRAGAPESQPRSWSAAAAGPPAAAAAARPFARLEMPQCPRVPLTHSGQSCVHSACQSQARDDGVICHAPARDGLQHAPFAAVSSAARRQRRRAVLVSRRRRILRGARCRCRRRQARTDPAAHGARGGRALRKRPCAPCKQTRVADGQRAPRRTFVARSSDKKSS
jgi:hypothetical protein